jgi:uncharacterized protein (DUF2147 family)
MSGHYRALISVVVLAILVQAGASPAQPAAGPTPVGRWRTFDDRSGQERGLVRIEEHGGLLSGRVVGILNPQEAVRVCEKCTDARKGQSILGMTILTGMRREGDRWVGGEILDPETGSVYHCSMRLEDGGVKLVLRGYIGISLFGRSQTWLRQGG